MNDLRDSKPKLYSQRSISIATSFGGPLAAGILMQRNFINSGNELYGKHALSIGILSTILIFVGLNLAPENVVEKIPYEAIPLIYTTTIYFVVERTFGKQLKGHKSANGTFYSGWKAAKVGFFSMCIQAVGVFGIVYYGTQTFDAEAYDRGLVEFFQNEEKALNVFTFLENEDFEKAEIEINDNGIPLWLRNLEIVNSMNSIEDLPEEFIDQNKVLTEYCQLRLREFRFIQKTILESTDEYELEIILARKGIEEIMNKLQKEDKLPEL